MKKRTVRLTKTLIALTGVLALSSCKKKEAEDVQTTDTAAKEAGEVTAAAAAAAATGSVPVGSMDGAASLLTAAHYFEADTKALVGINLKAIASSKTIADFTAKNTPDLTKELESFKGVCGASPLELVSQLVFGVRELDKNEGAKRKSKKGEFVNNTLVWGESKSRSELESCAKAIAKRDEKTLTISEEDGLSMYAADGETITVAWLDDTHFLATSDAMDPAWLKKRALGVDGLNTASTFTEVQPQVDTSSGLWFFVGMTPDEKPISQKLEDSPLGNARTFFGAISLQKGLGISGGVMFKTPADAAKATKDAKGMLKEWETQIPFLATYIKKVEVSSDEEKMNYGFLLSEQDLAALGALASGFLGGAGNS